MEQPEVKHERVRFRRDQIVRLDSLPSAAEGPPPLPGPARQARALRWTAGILVAFLFLAVALPVAVYLIGIPSVGREKLRSESEAVLTRLLGVPVIARIGEPVLSLDGTRLLALDVSDISVSRAGTGAPVLEAGSLRIGMRIMPIFGGDLRLGSAGIADALFDLTTLPTDGERVWYASMIGPDGLIEPELVGRAVFEGLHRLFDGFDAGSTRQVELSNVRIRIPNGSETATLTIETGSIERDRHGALTMSAVADIDGKRLTLEGSAGRNAQTGLVEAVSLSVAFDAMHFPHELPPGAIRRSYSIVGFGSQPELAITGGEVAGEQPKLSVEARLNKATIEFANGDRMVGDGVVAMRVDGAGRKVEIESAMLTVGRARYVAHGAVGPAPVADGGPLHYRYELVSDGSVIASDVMNEPDLVVFARLAGSFDPALVRLTANEIGLRTNRGELMGAGEANFVAGGFPGFDMVLNVPEMPVGYAKQIWPFFAATGARNWAGANLFGGTLRNSSLSLSVPPGRIGDGVPLNENEISGHFEITGTRFDVSGEIPPVRDGQGIVDLRGTDVDITLQSGTVYLGTGRTVAARDGRFAIRRGELPPVMGDLDIHVSGSADAIAELATYRPIDALRHLPVRPEDLSGSMSGEVKALIPLQKEGDAERSWEVELDFEGLSVSRPVEGQTLSDASGTLKLDPDTATFEARGKLNGMPATMTVREPLGEDKSARLRDVAVTLDDKARNALSPALSSVLSGPVTLKVEAQGEIKAFSADLGAARLSLPWVGWSKGAGVPATLNFKASGSGGDMMLSDIRLSGQSFSLSGSATVAKGVLSQAQLRQVRLNRNDDVSVDLKRSGGGYSVTVRGDSLDARALIKQALESSAGGGSGDGGVPVTVDADIANVGGFNGETLSNVKLGYSSSGAAGRGLTLSASTRSGAGLLGGDHIEGGVRKVQMQSKDAGAVLRFLDLYPHMQGGQISLDLSGKPGQPLRGQVDARSFALVDEPRLRTIVATRPTSDSRSLNDAVRRDIDTSRVQFDRGFAQIEKGDGYLTIANGALRGPLLGTTFQGTLFDQNGQMAMTGTFMPAYGLNSLFAEIPLIGLILGNGRDRGLIGITYKVAGDAKSPSVIVNPISVIAPGIFRSIFEFQ